MKPKLTYANVVATLALFVALTGTGAYAASKIRLPVKSVGQPQLRPGAIVASKIRKSAVTTPKIRAGAVKKGKLANHAVNEAKLTNAAVGTAILQDSAVTNQKIAPEAVTGDKVAEYTLGQVPSAASAGFALSAESANPPAFARVTKEATLDASQSKNVTVKAGSLGGIYCVTAVGFNPRGAQVTPYFEGGGDIDAFAKIGGTLDCPAPAVEVQTFEGGARTIESFYVALYR